ncbi:MAG: hypothetical protein HYS14_01440, partial [Candidatus Rokubacteria bacterium]|nr:hypothetical protein [Candidatus Rokubacteria bacterium]
MQSAGRHPSDKRQLVLGAALSFDVNQIRVFVESLRASGYAGDIAILVDLTSRRPVDYLRRHGAQPVRTWCIRRLHGPIHSYRYACFAAYLRQHARRYDQVLISDVRDVVFQSHPFIGVTSPACHFFLESARLRIGSEPNNARWMRIFLPPVQAAQMAEYPVSCGGVVLGGVGAMTLYLERMSAYIRAIPLLTRRKHGAD